MIETSSGESLFEAYHSVLSYLLGDENVYYKLANLVNADYMSGEDVEMYLFNNKPNENIIYNNADQDGTHYKYYDGKRKLIYDPYEICQIPKTHGNCLFYALYFASMFNNPNHRAMFPDKIINTSVFTSMETFEGTYYIKITKNKQLAYKSFVYNDFVIMKAIMDILNTNKTIQNSFKNTWKQLTATEKKDRDIPPKYTATKFIKDIMNTEVFGWNIDNTFEMTWSVVILWDMYQDDYVDTPYKLGGIEGAVNNIDKYNYEFSLSEKMQLPFI